MDLQQTACYACTDWHTCLVFQTAEGVRLPLCESCLRQIVPRAIAAQQPPEPLRAAAGAGRRR